MLAKTVFVGGISKKVQEDDLKDSFKPFGSV
jgi:RNA recognition motif-containing protein